MKSNILPQNPNIFYCSIAIALIFSLCSNVSFAQYTPGATYYDSTGFVKYLAGNLPIIISAPHGGSLEPDSIPDRDCTGCTYVKDAWTQTIAEGMYTAFHEQTGCYPHVVINLLHRKKFDANRDIDDAADGNPLVEKAWYGYHALIDSAKNQVVQAYDRGLFLDLHGHAHDTQRIELGYLLSGAELRQSDAILNTNEFVEESSIRTLSGDNLDALTHAELLRGFNSFGTILDNKGFRAVPSIADPFPEENEPYFSGGYNTVRHGSRDNGGNIDAIQIECNQEIRFNSALRAMLIDSMPTSVNQYIDFHYHDHYLDDFCNLTTSLAENISVPTIEFFPNPVRDYLHIRSELDHINLSIYNVLGQKVSTHLWSGSPLDFSSLSNGYYFIQFSKDKLLLDAKMLIKY